MAHRATLGPITLAVSVARAAPVFAQATATAIATPRKSVVVDVRSDRMVLLDIAEVDGRLLAVGERGFTLVSTDAGRTWKGQPTAVSRTLTGVAFKDDKVGIAVGHGGTVERSEDGGTTWTAATIEDAGSDSLLG